MQWTPQANLLQSNSCEPLCLHLGSDSDSTTAPTTNWVMVEARIMNRLQRSFRQILRCDSELHWPKVLGASRRDDVTQFTFCVRSEQHILYSCTCPRCRGPSIVTRMLY